MPPNSKTFSESWYRIANQCITLRPGVEAHRQYYRGERWYVLQDPYNNSFFRVRPQVYEFVVRLHPKRTVEEAWQECIDRFPDEAPGQEEVIRLLSQMYHANLLQYQAPADTLVLFKRFRKRKEGQIRSRFTGFMFPKIPLFDPDQFLVKTLPLVKPFLGWFGMLLWLVVVGFGLKAVIDHADKLVKPFEGILSMENLGFLYLGMVVLKLFHEFGHAYTCRKYGGEVHQMGVMLLIFTPVPFMDASSSWGFRERHRRVVVGASGMLVEIFVAAIAAVIWANTGEGALHRLCYNMMFVASISTVLFNINPLLRFDGYYILSDLLDIPNLHGRSKTQLKHFCEYYLFGVRSSTSPARSRTEAWWLGIFGVLSGIYRILLFTAIVFFVADHLLIVGLVMAFLFVIMWGVLPIGKIIHYLATAPVLFRKRARAVLVTSLLLLAVVLPLQYIPVPYGFRAPGVVQAVEFKRVYVLTAGRVINVHKQPGSHVFRGDRLFEFNSPQLDSQIKTLRARMSEVEWHQRKSLVENPSERASMDAVYLALREQMARLQKQEKDLVIYAPQDGVWHSDWSDQLEGRWLSRGVELGMVLEPEEYEFRAVVAQSEASRLFEDQLQGAGVKLRGQSRYTFPVGDWVITPVDRRQLPSRALSMAAGGGVATTGDAQNMTTIEPYFEVNAPLMPHEEGQYFHGLSGQIRFQLPAQPLLPRWIRDFRQMLQTRYRI